MGHWRDFAKDPAAKKVKASNYKVTQNLMYYVRMTELSTQILCAIGRNEEPRKAQVWHGKYGVLEEELEIISSLFPSMEIARNFSCSVLSRLLT